MYLQIFPKARSLMYFCLDNDKLTANTCMSVNKSVCMWGGDEGTLTHTRQK